MWWFSVCAVFCPSVADLAQCVGPVSAALLWCTFYLQTCDAVRCFTCFIYLLLLLLRLKSWRPTRLSLQVDSSWVKRSGRVLFCVQSELQILHIVCFLFQEEAAVIISLVRLSTLIFISYDVHLYRNDVSISLPFTLLNNGLISNIAVMDKARPLSVFWLYIRPAKRIWF